MPDYSQRNYWLKKAQLRGLSSQMRSYFTQKAAELLRKLRDAVLASGRQISGRTAQLNAAARAASGKQVVDTNSRTKAFLKGLVDEDALNTYKATADYGKARMFDSLLAPILWIRGKKFDWQLNYQDYLDDYWRLKLGRNYAAVQNGALLVGAGAATLATAPLTTAKVVAGGARAIGTGAKALGTAGKYIGSGKAFADAAKAAVNGTEAAANYIRTGKAIGDSAKVIGTTLGRVGSGVLTALQGAKSAWGATPEMLHAVSGSVKSLPQVILSGIKAAPASAWNGIKSGAKSILNTATKPIADKILAAQRFGRSKNIINFTIKHPTTGQPMVVSMHSPGSTARQTVNTLRGLALLTLPKSIRHPHPVRSAINAASKYRELMAYEALGKGGLAAAELKAIANDAPTNITYTGDTPLMVKLRIARGLGFFPEGITTPEQKQAYIRLLVNWQVRHTDTGSTAASMTLQFAAPYAAGHAGSIVGKGLRLIPGMKPLSAILPTVGFLTGAHMLPNALAQKTRKALLLFGALAQTAQKTDVKPMSAYYLTYQALKDPAKKALLARQMVQKAYKDRMFSSVLANKLKLISNTGNRGIIPSYLAAKKLLRGLQLTPNLWQGIIDSQDIPYFGNIVQLKLQQGTQLAVNKFGTLLQSYIQAYSKLQDPVKKQQLAKLIAQKITASRMPNFIRNQLIEGKIRGNQQVGGIKQLNIDKGVFGKLSVLQMKAVPKAGKLVLQQMQHLPDTRDVYLKYTDPTVVLQLQYMGLQSAYNWFNQKIDDPNTDVYEVGLAALLFQRAFNLSDLQALSNPIAKKLKQKCTDQILNNPDNVRKAVSLWVRSKGLDGFAGFLKNPISFYGMLAVLIGAPLLMGFSAGLQAPQQPVRSYQYKPLTGMLGTGSSYADALI